MYFVKERAHGKINVGLDVLRKREDGYHEVKMVMQTVGIYDGIDITRSPGEREITIETNLKYLPTGEGNLAYRAANMLMEEFGINEKVHIKMKKMIPVAAGMAGGSADCAAVFRGVNKLFNLGLSLQDLKERGVKLGADVPYCIEEGTALCEGIGEKLTTLPPMPDCRIILVKPHINISTKYVYENLRANELTYHPDIDGMVCAIKNNDLYGVTDRMGNVLETVTETEYGIITELKDKLKKMGAVNAIMSGSGSTVFGIYDDNDKAMEAYKYMKESGLGRQVYITEPYNKQ
ncbi:MAG: 4-(cytidine 5'-diphospho)-2-C-methyl-D-erythritol kinase [Lachnospiraceae bacterium]|nr:4-(cytidine 5'-diphospho)-2-C-methyl-D-erythritol kinase [Lachnospiraceae bacterium]